jgi:FtsP/CotA-like multicopper oxidase with cupredoxin domain
MMMTTRRFLATSFLQTIIGLIALQSIMVCSRSSVVASSSPTPVASVPNGCSRPAAGAAVQNPPDLFSNNGVLTVNFSYQSTTDLDGRTLFCFMTPDGLENPTLHVHPGDHLIINTTNNTAQTPPVLEINPPNCGATDLTSSSVNIHFHGTNTPPQCYQDEVIHTLINSGQTFRYDVHFPSDEPPGLYWYHPHAHMLVESALQGGASGALIVEGIQNFQPAVAGLVQQILLIRDQNVAGNPTPGGNIPSWDLTLNNVPISYPAEVPAIIQMGNGEPQLWRVSNSSSDTIIDLQLQFDGVPQRLRIVGLDGVPTSSQDGTSQGRIVKATHILIPTAGRAEFIVNAPSSTVKDARLVTLGINTGPDGDNDPQRTLATIQTPSGTTTVMSQALARITSSVGARWKHRFEGLAGTTPALSRTPYFSENNPLSQFFITVDGATPTLFDPNNPPAIVTTQGSVEDWTIQNQSLENHEFHMHQIHFLVESQDNFEINGSRPNRAIRGQVLDTIQIPFWDGNPSHSFPSVTVRMDFRGMDIGDFVYHCHIAEHEDDGMMAIIRVEPSSVAAAIERLRLSLASLGESVGLLRRPNPSKVEELYEWCVRGRLARRYVAAVGAQTTRPAETRSGG